MFCEDQQLTKFVHKFIKKDYTCFSASSSPAGQQQQQPQQPGGGEGPGHVAGGGGVNSRASQQPQQQHQPNKYVLSAMNECFYFNLCVVLYV